MTDLSLEGMALSPGVVETIISIATKEVEGVASVGPSGVGGLRSIFGSKQTSQGIEIDVNDDDRLEISIRIDVYYGFILPEVAANVRKAVSDAVASQIGIPVANVDVYIDGIQFAD